MDKYSDFANLNLAGKGVVILYGAPEDSLGRDILETAFAQRELANKAKLAYAKGAAVVFMVDNDEDQFKAHAQWVKESGIGLAENQVQEGLCIGQPCPGSRLFWG
jgi:hypothetical protein